MPCFLSTKIIISECPLNYIVLEIPCTRVNECIISTQIYPPAIKMSLLPYGISQQYLIFVLQLCSKPYVTGSKVNVYVHYWPIKWYILLSKSSMHTCQRVYHHHHYTILYIYIYIYPWKEIFLFAPQFATKICQVFFFPQNGWQSLDVPIVPPTC
jgi:hypothetical protein